MSTAMVVAPQHMALEPRDVGEALVMATKLVASGLLPKTISRPEAAFAIILAGRELGLPAMQSLRSIHIIEGKPVLSADLMAALCKRSPDCALFRLVESTDKIATYEAQRTGEASATRMSYTIDQAAAAGLVGKDNWKRHTAAMLRARAASAISRAVFPDLLVGCYSDDEGEEIRRPREPVIDTTATQEHQPTVAEIVADWSVAIEAADDLAELLALKPALGALHHDAKLALSAPYKAREKALRLIDAMPPMAAREVGEEG